VRGGVEIWGLDGWGGCWWWRGVGGGEWMWLIFRYGGGVVGGCCGGVGWLGGKKVRRVGGVDNVMGEMSGVKRAGVFGG